MHSTQTALNLQRCRALVADAGEGDQLHVLARNLLDHLVEMHNARRLRSSVFLLALDSLELVPGLEDCVAVLRSALMEEEV